MSSVRNNNAAEEIDDIYFHLIATKPLTNDDQLDLSSLDPEAKRGSSQWAIDDEGCLVSSSHHSRRLMQEQVSLHLGDIDETEFQSSSDASDDENDINYRAKQLAGLLGDIESKDKDNGENDDPGDSFVWERADIQGKDQPNDVYNRTSLSVRLVSSLRASIQKEEPLKRGSRFVSQSVSRVRMSLRQRNGQ